jgi:formylglycine-generating enzyme required for sulfatase activity
VFEFDYTLKSQDENSHIVVKYRADENNSDVIKFNPYGFGLQGKSGNYHVKVASDQVYHFQILVLEDQLAVFINDKLIEYSDEPTQARGTGIGFAMYAETGFDASLDNIKFWDLDNFTIPTSTPQATETQISTEDGMTMVYVPAGEFSMGSDSGDSNEKPVHTVYLDSFWIDQTEVTNKMYSLCVAAGVCQSPKAPNSYSRTSYYGNPEFENYPIVYVDWDMANTYCTWAGRRIPTEAEWEKAARGTTSNRFPWGDEMNCDRANGMNCKGDTTQVGQYEIGKSPYGVLDMAGNVMEWVADWYSITYYYASSSRENPLGPTSGNYHVLRGGSWKSNENSNRSTYRFGFTPDATNYYLIGFRCALGTTSDTNALTPSPPAATATPRVINPSLYLYVKQNFTWHDAVEYCSERGGHLVTIQDAVENLYIYQLTEGWTWLGATDEIEEGTWVWVSGEPWKYAKWHPGQPSGEDYLSYNGMSGASWDDVEGSRPFVCEWEPVP